MSRIKLSFKQPNRKNYHCKRCRTNNDDLQTWIVWSKSFTILLSSPEVPDDALNPLPLPTHTLLLLRIELLSLKSYSFFHSLIAPLPRPTEGNICATSHTRLPQRLGTMQNGRKPPIFPLAKYNSRVNYSWISVTISQRFLYQRKFLSSVGWKLILKNPKKTA